MFLPKISRRIHQGTSPVILPGSLHRLHKKNCKRILSEISVGVFSKFPPVHSQGIFLENLQLIILQILPVFP